AAIFLVQNKPRIEGEEVEFFQGRFVRTHDELSEMSDRPLAGKERWIPDAEFMVSSANGDDEEETDAQSLPVLCAKDQGFGGRESPKEKRQGIWRYRVDPLVWRCALKHGIFEPSSRNAALYNRFMAPVVKLVDEWWEKIDTSAKFENHLAEIQKYHETLKP